MSVTLTLWNRWIRPRFERCADGTACAYFGVGRLTWQRKIKYDSDGSTATTKEERP